MRTHVLPLPPWRGGEGGSELDGTLKDNEQGRTPRGDDELENIFDDNNDQDPEKGGGNAEHATTPRRWSEVDQPAAGNGTESSRYSRRRGSRSSSENKGGVDGERNGRAAQDKGPRIGGSSSAARLERASTRGGGGLKDVGREDFVLTDGSSDDELSCSSPANSKGGGLMTGKGSRLRNENPTLPSEPAGDVSSPTSTNVGVGDRRRHSSGATPTARGLEENGHTTENGRSEKRVFFSEGPAIGGRRASSTPRSSGSENQSAEGEAGAGASTCRRYSDLEGRQNDRHAAERSSDDKAAAVGQQGLSIDVDLSPSPGSGIPATRQTTAVAKADSPQGDQNDTTFAPSDNVKETGASTGVDGGLDSGLHGVATKETEPHGGPREEEHTDAREATARTATCVAAPETTVGDTSTIKVSVSTTTGAAAPGEVAQLGAGVVGKERQFGDETGVTSSVSERPQPVGEGGKFEPALTSSSSDLDMHRSSTATVAHTESIKRCGEETKMSNAGAAASSATATDVAPSSALGAGSGVGGGVKACGSTLDLSGSNDKCDAPQSGAAATLTQAVPAGAIQDIANNVEDATIENNAKALMDKSGVAIRPPLEAITELQSGESSGDSFNGDARGSAALTAPSAAAVSTLDSEYCGGAMRKPYCLSPTNVMRQARGPGATAAAGSSCRERERLVARIQLSAGVNNAAAATAVPSVNTGRQGVVSGPVPLNSSTIGSCFDGGFTPDRGRGEEGGWTSGNGSPASYGNADTACLRSAGKTPSAPEREECGGGWLERSGAPIENDRCSSSSPSSRFYLPSSETKTAPLCGTGGSTSLYEGPAIAANKPTASAWGREGAGWFSRVGPEASIQGGGGGHTETMGVIARGEAKEGGGLLRLDEEQLAVSLRVTLSSVPWVGEKHSLRVSDQSRECVARTSLNAAYRLNYTSSRNPTHSTI